LFLRPKRQLQALYYRERNDFELRRNGITRLQSQAVAVALPELPYAAARKHRVAGKQQVPNDSYAPGSTLLLLSPMPAGLKK
jgi:hypothetical protein